MDIIGMRLKSLRVSHNLTQDQAALALGFKDAGSYRKYESGKILPGADKIRTIADYYKVSADYLLGRTDTP